MKNNKIIQPKWAKIALTSLTLALPLVFSLQASAQEKNGVNIGIANAPNVKTIPGTGDAQQGELIKQSNTKRADLAEKNGQSTVPIITANNGANQSGDPFADIQQKTAVETKKDTPKTIKEDKKVENKVEPPAAPVAPPPVAPKQVVYQQAKKAPETVEREANMQKAITGLLNGWNPVGQRVEVEYKAQALSDSTSSQAAVTKTNTNALAASANNGGNNPNAPQAADIKAGNILHAVILTSVNSDEPGPVLAQIVSGPYTGSRLMGNFKLTNTKEKLILTFSVLTMPSASNSYSINGFAIDPDSGRTALQSDVDHHYLNRYGMLLGASFLKGYSQALKQSNTTTQVSTGAGGTTSTQTTPPLNAKDKAIIALGEVGNALSSALQQNVNRPYTVTLDAGTPVGVLMMQDVSFK